jgi:hypothetical protein
MRRLGAPLAVLHCTFTQSPVTPSDLRSDPELAILDELDHTLELAVYGYRAAILRVKEVKANEDLPF